MYFHLRLGLCWQLCLWKGAFSTFTPNSTVPAVSYTQNSTTVSSNLTLGAWPSHIPWRMSIAQDLDMEVYYYGNYAPSSLWTGIRGGLKDIRKRVQDCPDWSSRPCPALRVNEDFNSGFVTVRLTAMQRDPSKPYLSANEVAKVIQTTFDIFFIYQDHPRDFNAILISHSRHIKTQFVFFTRATENPWPQNLPVVWRLGELDSLEIYLYGRDEDQSAAPTVRAALNEILNMLVSKDDPPWWERIPNDSYSSGYVNLEIEQGSAEKHVRTMNNGDIVSMVSEILGRIENMGYSPREIAARYTERSSERSERVVVGKIYLTFTALDSDGVVSNS